MNSTKIHQICPDFQVVRAAGALTAAERVDNGKSQIASAKTNLSFDVPGALRAMFIAF